VFFLFLAGDPLDVVERPQEVGAGGPGCGPGCGPGSPRSGPGSLAVLQAKIKVRNIFGPPDPAPNHRSSNENGSPDSPPGPPGEWAKKIKTSLSAQLG
jgi:hypothetical protein